MTDSLEQLQQLHPAILSRRVPDGFPGLDFVQVTVPGSEASSVWRTLREAVEQTRRWPVIVGSSEALESTVNFLQSQREDSPSPQEQVRNWIQEGEQTSFAEWLQAQRNPQRRIAEYLETAERMAASGSEDAARMFREAAEAIANAPPRPQFDPAEYPWPEQEKTSVRKESLAVRDPDTMEFENGRVVRDSQFYDEIHLMLLPTTAGWEAPAWLGFGNFNDCPPPPVHVNFAKWVFDNHHAELMTATNDILEFVPRAPIESRDTALRVANDLKTYCFNLEFGGQTLQEVALALVRGSLWTFWWD